MTRPNGPARLATARPSIGGETLQFRTTSAFPEWRRVVLYRQVPADGPLTITLGLAAFGRHLARIGEVGVVRQPLGAHAELGQLPAERLALLLQHGA